MGNKEILKIAKDIQLHYKPEKIVLFGSFAKGKADKYSDIDFLVVKKTNERFLDRIKRIRRIVGPETPCDILVFTPQEFSKAKESELIQEVTKTGKTLYEE